MPPEGYTSKSKAILLGDSHASMYASALRSHFYREHGKELVYRFRAGCKPFLDLDRHSPGYSPQDCPRSVNPAIEQAINDPEIDTVVMVAALVSFRDQVYRGFDGPPSEDIERNYQIMSRAMDDTFARLAASGKKIMVFFTTPKLDFEPAQCQERPFRWRSVPRADCFLTQAAYQKQQRWSREKLEDIARRYPAIKLFDPAGFLCQDGRCSARKGGKLIYADHSHLNARGAELVAENFDF